MTKKEKIRETVAELIALEITKAFCRGELGGKIVTEKREDYRCADEILTFIKKSNQKK